MTVNVVRCEGSKSTVLLQHQDITTEGMLLHIGPFEYWQDGTLIAKNTELIKIEVESDDYEKRVEVKLLNSGDIEVVDYPIENPDEDGIPRGKFLCMLCFIDVPANCQDLSEGHLEYVSMEESNENNEEENPEEQE